jgi:hypothetical protein
VAGRETCAVKLSAPSERDAAAIWNQQQIPVVVRQSKGSLLVRLPYAQGNKEWLRDERRGRPKWDASAKRWTLARAWFDDFVRRAVDRFGRVYVIQPYREMEKCARPCWEAHGFTCECSCMGANHGSQDPSGWREITETFAVRWGERQFGCRLITARSKHGKQVP